MQIKYSLKSINLHLNKEENPFDYQTRSDNDDKDYSLNDEEPKESNTPNFASPKNVISTSSLSILPRNYFKNNQLK